MHNLQSTKRTEGSVPQNHLLPSSRPLFRRLKAAQCLCPEGEHPAMNAILRSSACDVYPRQKRTVLCRAILSCLIQVRQPDQQLAMLQPLQCQQVGLGRQRPGSLRSSFSAVKCVTQL